MRWKILPLLFFLCYHSSSFGQRTYQSHSVLSTGNWFRFSTAATGIYKIDLNFLSQLGFKEKEIASDAIQIFGNDGSMLSEDPGGRYSDDLTEIALWLEDGGDGKLNGSDYILMYAPGPQDWNYDAAQRTYLHQKNLYADLAYYYIKMGAGGKRVASMNALSGSSTTILNTYQFHTFYELDSVNLLGSGKLWLGEEFSTQPGKLLTKSFPFTLPAGTASPIQWDVNVLIRSIGTASQFQVSTGNNNLGVASLPAVTNGAYDLMAQSQQFRFMEVGAAPNGVLQLQFQPAAVGATGWLDWITVQGMAPLSMKGKQQLSFSNNQSVQAGGNTTYQLLDADSVDKIWDVTNPSAPQQLPFAKTGAQISFRQSSSVLHEFIAFSSQGYLIPKAVGKVNNQDLHGLPATDYLIISPPAFVPQAQRLGAFHQQREGLQFQVVTPEQVYHEFSSGTPDPTAIRDFVKMFYDRAGADTTRRPRYLLLFGDASYDYKKRLPNNPEGVPCFESEVSLDPLSTYTSDDFFGFLGDTDKMDGNTPPQLDIGIGRIPATTVAAAQAMVDKIIAYHSAAAMGPWKNELSFIADDEDANLFLQDAELTTASVSQRSPNFHLEKIYLDAYQQETGPAGSRYPNATLTIKNKMVQGNLIWSYNGHGGYRRLAEEVVLDKEIISGLKNENRLPLFITATCDVAPYDNPLIESIGEQLLLQPKTGAIALMTTTRLVFAFSNRVLQKNYLDALLQRNIQGRYPTLGEAVMQAKNYTYRYFGDVVNNRKFTLLGDPALRLSIPTEQVRLSSLNGHALSVPDTLRSLQNSQLEGVVLSLKGDTLNDFNGTVFVSVFDKPQSSFTKGNDPTSPVTSFSTQNSILFQGKATVTNGRFSLQFKVPHDIDYKYGKGKILMYAENGLQEARGVYEDAVVGGSGPASQDQAGPEIKAYLNDEKFVSGGITQQDPLLLLHLADSSGINRMGTGLGHDLQVQLDDDPKKTFVLNDYFIADKDDYQKGTVRFQLPAMEPGAHQLTIKAWDNANNMNLARLDLKVIESSKFTLSQVLNYPNPFHKQTSFWFQHNRAGSRLNISIQVFTISGKLIKTLTNAIFSTGNRSDEVKWDGRDEFGDPVGRGVYIYKLRVQAEDGSVAEQWEKLYIL